MTLKLQASPRISAAVTGTSGDKAVRANGTITVQPDYPALAVKGAITQPESANLFFRIYDSSISGYVRASLQAFLTLVGLTTARIKLNADLNLYARAADGSDANDGSADDAAHAFLTLQHAYDVIAKSYDLNGYNVNIYFRGNFTAGVNGLAKCVGQKSATSVAFRGVAAANVTVANGHAFNAGDDAGGAAWFYVTGSVTIGTSGGSGSGLRAVNGSSQIVFDTLTFGSVIDNHLEAHHSGYIKALGAYNVAGGSTNGSHAYAASNATIVIYGQTITFTNAPNFAVGTMRAGGGFLYCASMTFTNGGTVTGPRAIAIDGGRIICDGEGVLPGNAASTEFNTGAITSATGGGVAAQQVSATLSAGTGALTNATGTLFVRRLPGKMVFIRGSITITTNGTAAGYLQISLPTLNGTLYSAVAPQLINGRRNDTGPGVHGFISNSDMKIYKDSDGSYPGGDGAVIYFSGVYETNVA